MTRFQASGPRIDYTPVQSEKPFKQVVGLYNMWQSLSPETREWIGDWFRRRGKVKFGGGLDPSLDTSLARRGDDFYSSLGIERPKYEYDRDFDEDLKTNDAKSLGQLLESGEAEKLDWSKINPFDNSEQVTESIVFGTPGEYGNEIPTVEEAVKIGRMQGDKPKYRAIVGMSPAVEQFFTGDSWRVR